MSTRHLAALALALSAPAPARAAEPLPVDPAVLARARALKSLPCAGTSRSAGFAPDEGAPAAWHIAGTLVSVRRREGERIAFVLAPPPPGGGDCAVRDLVILPRDGSPLACALQDGSVQGLGVQTLLRDGRRDLLFWRADGEGGLRRAGEGDDAFRSDGGPLICALPDPIQ